MDKTVSENSGLVDYYNCDPPDPHDPDGWHRVRRVGVGTFSTVYLEERQNARFVREVQALARLGAPRYETFFARFLGWYDMPDDKCFAMEYFELGDLGGYLKSRTAPIPQNESRQIMSQLLRGMEMMHDAQFIHRDLKPSNIFVVQTSPRWRVKIGDFGMSKHLHSLTEAYTEVGTRQYMAPEILDALDVTPENASYSNAVDLWSLGVIAYELFSNSKPFPSNKVLHSYYYAKPPILNVDPLRERQTPEEFISLIGELLHVNPKERPTAQQAQRDWTTLQSIIPVTVISETSTNANGSNLPSHSFEVADDLRKLSIGNLSFNRGHEGQKTDFLPTPQSSSALVMENPSQGQNTTKDISSSSIGSSLILYKTNQTQRKGKVLENLKHTNVNLGNAKVYNPHHTAMEASENSQLLKNVEISDPEDQIWHETEHERHMSTVKPIPGPFRTEVISQDHTNLPNPLQSKAKNEAAAISPPPPTTPLVTYSPIGKHPYAPQWPISTQYDSDERGLSDEIRGSLFAIMRKQDHGLNVRNGVGEVGYEYHGAIDHFNPPTAVGQSLSDSFFNSSKDYLAAPTTRPRMGYRPAGPGGNEPAAPGGMMGYYSSHQDSLLTRDKDRDARSKTPGGRKPKGFHKDTTGLPSKSKICTTSDFGLRNLSRSYIQEWTKISRKLVSPRALSKEGEHFEERKEHVIVLRYLTDDEIQHLANLSNDIKNERHPAYYM